MNNLCDSKSCFARSESSILSSPTKFKVKWKTLATAHNRSIVNVDSDSKISLNQLANRCERQINISNKKFISYVWFFKTY